MYVTHNLLYTYTLLASLSSMMTVYFKAMLKIFANQSRYLAITTYSFKV